MDPGSAADLTLIWSRCRRCAEHGAIPGVLHRQSAQLMNKIGKIRDELCMCSLHVEYVFSVFKMRLRKRTDTRIQNGWLLGRKSEYILTY